MPHADAGAALIEGEQPGVAGKCPAPKKLPAVPESPATPSQYARRAKSSFVRYRGLLEAGRRVGRDRAADAAGVAGSRTSECHR
jgi:hypothetical protein